MPSSPTATDLFTALAGQQRRVTGIVAGLANEALREVVLPSGWSCLGMIQHLTLTTRFWFIQVMAGETGGQGERDDFHVPPQVSAASVVADFQAAVTAGTEAVRHLSLDTPPAWWPEGQWGGWRLDNLGEVLLHLLVETATHAGHLDVARELIDGCTWDYARGQVTPAPVAA